MAEAEGSSVRRRLTSSLKQSEPARRLRSRGSLFDEFWMKAPIRRTPPWLYYACFIPPALTLAAVFIQPYVDPSLLLRDPAAVAYDVGVPDHIPMYYGLVSNLGVVIWSSVAAVCLFVGLVLTAKAHDRKNSSFMIASGFMTAVLLIDDLFMIHEAVFRYSTGLGEIYILAFHGILFSTYLLVFARTILLHNPQFMVMSLLFFSASIGIDAIADRIARDMEPILYLYFEDSMKFFGIAAWAAFYFRASWELLISARPEQETA